MRNKIVAFLGSNPTQEEVELFYLKEILPHDKRSILEIIEEENSCG